MTVFTSEHVNIASVVGTYWFVSISMVYLNKVLMSSNDGLSIPAPLFVTWYQCVITALICYVAGSVGERARRQRNASYRDVSASKPENGSGSGSGSASVGTRTPPKPSSFLGQFPKATYELAVAQKIFPLSLTFVGMMTFNNLCLKYVQVSFYNVARSLTVVFNVLLSCAFLGTRPPSAQTVGCLVVVIGGFVIGGYGEIDFNLLGTVCGVTSSLFVSLNSILTKRVLPVVHDDHWKLTYYNNVNASLLFIPLTMYFEGDVISSHFDADLVSMSFWSAMTVAGFFGFANCVVSVLQIKATSPLSHSVSGTAKAAVQSLMAYCIWGNEATFLGLLGTFAVLGGSLLYALSVRRSGVHKQKRK